MRLGFGKGTLLISGILGIGALVKSGNQTFIVKSISITYFENSKNHLYDRKWRVEEPKAISDNTVAVVLFSGTVTETDTTLWGQDIRKERSIGVKINSDAKYEDAKNGKRHYTPVGNWKQVRKNII